MAARCAVTAGLLAGLAVLAGAALAAESFSQYPGWAQWRAAHPPRPQPAAPAERALLERHRPRLYLPPGHDGAIDFYRDYIGSGRLTDAAGRHHDPVSREALNAVKHEPSALFVHRPRTPVAAGRPALYARYDEAIVEFGAAAPRRLVFLTYHAVFPRSGVPAGLGGVRASALRLLGDLDDWHQLDHYTATTVVLNEAHCPLALMLQQHNYLRTYVFGESIALPADGRPEVDVAMRSNELFPHAREPRRHRATQFLTPKTLRYLLGFGEAAWNVADDVTHGADEIDYVLEYLPYDDAFYVFAGFLGERRSMPGRDGPPGADYNTLPALKPLGWQLLSGYWRENNRQDLARLEATWAKTGDPLDFVRAQGPAFVAATAGACQER